MELDFDFLEPAIHRILSSPGTDLSTISAKNVRRQLAKEDRSLSAEVLRSSDNKKALDIVIARVFERVNAEQAEEAEGSSNDIEAEVPARSEPRKRKQTDDETEHGEEEVNEDDQEETPPPPKKAKKLTKNELSDAELARQLSVELNGRSRRTSSKPRGNSNGTPKKSGRSKKSAATVNSDDGSDGVSKTTKAKRKSGGGGGSAKGGFAKEYILSEPLSVLLKADKLSRPQVVKQLWVYIKDNDLQNPGNKREIMCDESFRAVFGVDKIDMFKMNKVLGQHLHENEG